VSRGDGPRSGPLIDLGWMLATWPTRPIATDIRERNRQCWGLPSPSGPSSRYRSVLGARRFGGPLVSRARLLQAGILLEAPSPSCAGKARWRWGSDSMAGPCVFRSRTSIDRVPVLQAGCCGVGLSTDRTSSPSWLDTRFRPCGVSTLSRRSIGLAQATTHDLNRSRKGLERRNYGRRTSTELGGQGYGSVKIWV